MTNYHPPAPATAASVDDDLAALVPAAATTPLALAQARLAASRERLAERLLPRRPPPAPQPGPGTLPPLLARPLQALKRHLRGQAWLEPVIDGLGRWWARHPLRDAAELLGAEAAEGWREGVRPLLRQHPVASVAVAGAVGAALVGTRPWASPRLRAGLRPLPGRFGRWLWAQVPLQTVLTGAALMLATRGGGVARAGEDLDPPARSLPPEPHE